MTNLVNTNLGFIVYGLIFASFYGSATRIFGECGRKNKHGFYRGKECGCRIRISASLFRLYRSVCALLGRSFWLLLLLFVAFVLGT